MDTTFPFRTEPPLPTSPDGTPLSGPDVIRMFADLRGWDESDVAGALREPGTLTSYLATMVANVRYWHRIPREERYRISRDVLGEMREKGILWSVELDWLLTENRWERSRAHRPDGVQLPAAQSVALPVQEWLRENDLAEHGGGATLKTFAARRFRHAVLEHGKNLSGGLVRSWISDSAPFYLGFVGTALAFARNPAPGEEALEAGKQAIFDAYLKSRPHREDERKVAEEREILRRLAVRGLTDDEREQLMATRRRDLVYLDPTLSAEDILRTLEHYRGCDRSLRSDAPVAETLLAPGATPEMIGGLEKIHRSRNYLGMALDLEADEAAEAEKAEEGADIPPLPRNRLSRDMLLFLLKREASLGVGKVRRVLNHPHVSIEAVREIVQRVSSGDVRAEVASFCEFRQDPVVRKELLKSRALDVAKFLIQDRRPEEFRDHFRIIARYRPAQAAKILSAGVPDGVHLDPEDLVPLLEHSDHKVRTAAVLAVGGPETTGPQPEQARSVQA